MSVPITYSQNYLHNPRLVTYLINLAGIRATDLVLEIGPGKGIITESLAKRCSTVLAIEKDVQLAEYVQRKTSRYLNVQVIHQDFLTYELPKKDYKIVSNIPFSVTSELIKKILGDSLPPKECYLVMQEEAAKKLCGQPYGSETMVSLLYKPFFSFRILHTFKSSDFTPEPKVTSVFLQIKKLESSAIGETNAKLYRNFIAYGFTQYKPTVREIFRELFENAAFSKIAHEFAFLETAKPTELVFEQWIQLFKYFVETATRDKVKKISDSLVKLERMQKGLVKQHRTRRY